MSKSVMELKWSNEECEKVAVRMRQILLEEPSLTKLRAVRKAQECLAPNRQGFIAAWPLIEHRLLPFLTLPEVEAAPTAPSGENRNFQKVSSLAALEVAKLQRKKVVQQPVLCPRQLELGFSMQEGNLPEPLAAVPEQPAPAPVLKQEPHASVVAGKSVVADDVQARIALRSVVRKDRIQMELAKLMEAGVLAGFMYQAGPSARKRS